MAEHFNGPWKVGPYASDVWAPSAKGGDTKVCDIRAWGYLTGKGAGALGLSDDEAVAIQTANARLIAAAPDMLAALQEALVQIDDGPSDCAGTMRDGTRVWKGSFLGYPDLSVETTV